MPYISTPHNIQKTLQNQPKQKTEQINSREVRQDGYASRRVRAASPQALQIANPTRTRRLNRKDERVQKHSTTRRTVIAAGWVSRPISLHIDRLATEMHTTRSKAIRYLIELGLANNILGDHIKIIIATIRETTTREVRRSIKPLRDNSYRSAFYSAQNRTLLTNILHLFVKLLQEDPETTQEIFRESEGEARDLLRFLSPQLTSLIRENEKEQGSENGEGKV